MSQANQQDIEAWLWEAANILRGPVDPANLRDFVFPLLFLKRLSDTWDEEQASAIKTFGIDIDRETAADFHAFQIPEGCHWSDLRRAAENHGVLIQNIMQKIEEANPTRLSQIFGNAPWADHNKMPPERLEKLVSHFSQRDLSPSKVSNDLLGGGYEYLLKRFSDESSTSAGQFFTPRAVVHLLVRILGPQPTDSIYDPACGSGSLLLQYAKVLGKDNVREGFYGQEINLTTYNLCRINMFLHDINYEKFDIAHGDTLTDPHHWNDEPFEAIVSNPPYSINWAGDSDPLLINDDRFAPAGVLAPKSKADLAFTLHMLHWLAVNGTAAIVEFPGVMYRGGAEQKIRKYLVDNNYVDAVIQLPQDLFFGTSIATCILVLKKSKSDNKVLFINAEKNFVREGNKNKFTKLNRELVYDAYVARKDVDYFARLVDHAEIQAKDYGLSVTTYVTAEDSREDIDIVTLNREIAEIVQRQSSLRKLVDETVIKIEATH